MAKRKIDEQISYNWLFVVLSGLFMFVTGWAVYDEAYSRRPWKDYQNRFFQIEIDLAKQEYKLQESLLDASTCPEACAAHYEGQKGAAKTCETVCKDATHYAELAEKKAAIEAENRGPKKAEIQRIQGEIEALKQKWFDINQAATFTKAEWSEQDYYRRLARHEYLKNPDDASLKSTLDEEEKRAAELSARFDKEWAETKAAEQAQKDKEKELDELKREEEHKTISKEMEKLASARDSAKRAYGLAKANAAGLTGSKTEVKQFDLPKIGAVDRCTSCHMGTTRGGFEQVEETVFKSHPYRRTLLSLHPPEEFGCVSCHDGQGRATTEFYAHAPSNDEDPHAFHTHFWEFPLLKGPPGGDGTEYMETKCRSCHANQVEFRSYVSCASDVECLDVGDEENPAKCVDRPLADAAAAQKAFETLPGTPEGAFPEGEPGRPNMVCADKRGRPVLVDFAPNYTAGVKIVEEVGCYGCHPIDGFKDLPKPAPALVQVSTKIDPSYMVSWIQYPKEHRPNSRMPNFWPMMLEPEAYPYVVDVEAETKRRAHEAKAIAAFLVSTSKASQKYAYDVEKIPANVKGDVARGKKAMGELGCAACHDLPGDEANTPKRVNRASHFDHGPNLFDIGAKTSRDWIYSWIRNPKRYSPTTRMPNLRLTEQEAADIATYLFTLKGDKKFDTVAEADLADEALIKEGKGLVKKYGCYGCHLVEGYEEEPGIGADLSAFGVKLRERLDFGDYIVDHNMQTWNTWTISKLRHPRVYSYEAQSPVETLMPEFEFTEEEVRKVMVFLKSNRAGADKSAEVLAHELTGADFKRQRGRQMLRNYNCYGCHNVNDHQGELASLPHLSGSNAIYGPPPLSNQGLKAQPDWLFGFLKRPFRMRPLPKVRMPTFGFSDVEATNLVAMFSNVDGVAYPYEDYGTVGPESPADYTIGKALFDAAGCQQCHVVGELGEGPLPPEVKAPNLLMTQERLRPEWLKLWIANPDAMQKGTAMPGFWLSQNVMENFLQTNPAFQAAVSQVAPEIVKRYAASPQLQIEAVRNYLFRLGQPAPAGSNQGSTAALVPPAGGEPTPAPQ